MKRVIPMVLVLLMLASLFAGINMVELKDEAEMDSSGRAAYEIKLHDVIEPRETFTDMGGHTRNGIDVGDSVHFRPVIVNEGDNNQTEVNVRVTVTSGDVTIIDTEDDVICDVCDTTSLASGQFLDGGTYLVENADGTVLTWTPDTPGEYTVTVSVIVLDSAHDSDLTNNDMTYSVVVAHYHDIVFDMCWTDGNGDCLAANFAQGDGPHNFAAKINVSGSESWMAREVTIAITFSGSYDPVETRFNNDPIPSNGVVSMVLGTTQTVDIWQNISSPESPDTTQSNPCTNKDNPCTASRNIATYGVEETFTGNLVGDSEGQGGQASFSITGGLLSFKSYEPSTETFSDPNNPEAGEQTYDYMKEVDNDYDDRSGNNHASISGSFNIFHDIAVTSLTAGDSAATEGLINVGITKLFAEVINGGSAEPMNSYDWSVTFRWTDESGFEMTMDADECLYGAEPYTHSMLGEGVGESPAGIACTDVDFLPGRYTVTAAVNFIDYNNNNWDDMNSGNDMVGTFFESVNDIPTVYVSLGDDVVQPVIVGDSISFIARGADTESLPEMLQYSWTRLTPTGLENIETCLGMALCSFPDTDASWIGERPVTVTVMDEHGASQTDSISVNVWNNYETSATLTGVSVDYSLVYSELVNFSMTFTDASAITGATLGNNAGSYDSVAAFSAASTNVFSPDSIGGESLAITFAGDSATPYGLWLDLGNGFSMLSATTAQSGDTDVVMTYAHAGAEAGNLPTGTFAVFETSSSGGEPPATGISGLTATLKPDAQIELSWGLSDEGLVGSDDYVYVYHCDGAGCDALTGTAMPAMAIDSSGTTLNGQDGGVMGIVVRVENGQTDSNGDALFGTPVGSLEVTADGSVSPAPSNVALDATDAADSVAFTWTAETTDDTASWKLCWGGFQFAASDFDGLACSDTSDATGSLTLTKTEICGGTCSGNLYFAVGGVDTTGNVADAGAQLVIDMQEEVINPGVIEPEGGDGDDDGATNTAMIAIVILVVLAVIGGAFILTRGGGGDGEDKEWDY